MRRKCEGCFERAKSRNPSPPEKKNGCGSYPQTIESLINTHTHTHTHTHFDISYVSLQESFVLQADTQIHTGRHTNTRTHTHSLFHVFFSSFSLPHSLL